MTIGQSDDIYQTARAFASAGVLTIQTSRPDFQGTSYHVNANLKAGSFGLVNPSVLYNQRITDNTSFSIYGDFCVQMVITLLKCGMGIR